MRCARLIFKYEDTSTIDLFEKIKEVEQLDATYDIDINYLKVRVLEFNSDILVNNSMGYKMNVILDTATGTEIECPIYLDIPLEFNNVKIDVCKFENINNSIKTFMVDYIY